MPTPQAAGDLFRSGMNTADAVTALSPHLFADNDATDYITKPFALGVDQGHAASPRIGACRVAARYAAMMLALRTERGVGYVFARAVEPP